MWSIVSASVTGVANAFEDQIILPNQSQLTDNTDEGMSQNTEVSDQSEYGTEGLSSQNSEDAAISDDFCGMELKDFMYSRQGLLKILLY